MDHRDVGRIWDGNAPAWTELSREGFDVARDTFNSPAFFAMLPEVDGLAGLDIGCGEGHNTRALAGRGATMTAVDISHRFVHHARAVREPPIRYARASAVTLPFADESFDFATSFMCFQDVPEQDLVVREAWRVLRPGGFLQFSITHPCFQTDEWEWVFFPDGSRRGVICGNYFDPPQGKIERWIFSALPPERHADYPLFNVPVFPRTLSGWFDLLVDAGFSVERLGEPRPPPGSFSKGACGVAYFLHFLCRKRRTRDAQ